MAAFLQRSGFWLFLAVLLSVCVIQVAIGALPTRIYGHDFFVFLDGAWRVACGQIPCVDFYSGLGVLVWKPLQWALALYGYNAEAIGLARTFYTAVIGAWFLLLIRREPARIPSIVLGLFILIFVSAARPLGEYPTWVSHAMFYNRVGYALLFLILLEQLPVSRFQAADNHDLERRQHRMQFWGGVSTGAALACTVLLKISFVAPAAALLASGLLLFGVNRKHLAGVLAGGLAIFTLAIACLHFQPAAFLRETITLGHEREGMLWSEAVSAFVQDIGEVGFTLVAGLAVGIASFANRQIALKYMFATVAIVGCDIYCRATNAMRGDLPLAAFWCLSGAILLFSFSTTAVARRQIQLQRVVALLVLCPIAIPIFLKDFTSSAYAAYKTAATRNSEGLHFDSAQLRSWVPLDWQGDDPTWQNENGTPLILTTNDGIHLLTALSRPNETVSCISFANPFSFALRRRPPQGGAVWLNLNNNISARHPLPAGMLIGHPDLLMVQRSTDAEGEEIKAILSMYPETADEGLRACGRQSVLVPISQEIVRIGRSGELDRLYSRTR